LKKSQAKKAGAALKFIGMNLLLFVAFSLAWFIPTILNTGGLQGYLNTSQGLTGSQEDKVLIWFGTNGQYLLNNSLNYLVFLTEALSPIGLVFIAWAFFRYVVKGGWKFGKKRLFFLLWVAPGMLFYLFYIEKAGYLMIAIPPLLLLAFWSIKHFFHRTKAISKKVGWADLVSYAIIAIFIIWFVVPASKAGIPQKVSVPAFIVQSPLSDYNWDVSSREIKQKDFTFAYLENYLRTNYPADDTVFLWAGGYPTWRHVSYYLPEYQSYWLIDASVSGSYSFGLDYYKAFDGQVTSFSGKPFWIDGKRPERIQVGLGKNIQNLVLIAGNRTTMYAKLAGYPDLVKTVALPNHQVVLTLSTPLQQIELDGFSITRE